MYFEILNNQLWIVNKWLNINKLSLNIKKSKYVICHTIKKNVQSVALKSENVNTEWVAEYIFFELFFGRKRGVNTNLWSWLKSHKMTSVPGGDTRIPEHCWEVLWWWPPFLRWSIRLSPYFIHQHNPIDPSFCRKKSVCLYHI